MNGRHSTILNSIITNASNSMSQSIHQNSIVNITMNGVNIGYNTIENTQYARGLSKPIVCGKSMCGSNSSHTEEYCKYR